MNTLIPKIYPSKISYGLLSILVIVFGLMGFTPVFDDAAIHVIIIMVTLMIASTAFVMHAFLTTRYWIENDQLRIKAGLMNNMTIPIEKIHKIEKSNSWLASPAASFDRIEIHYEKWNSVLISPKDKKGLISELKKLNPDILVKL